MLLDCRHPLHTNSQLGMACSCQLSLGQGSRSPLGSRNRHPDARDDYIIPLYTESRLSLRIQHSSQAPQDIIFPQLSQPNSTNQLHKDHLDQVLPVQSRKSLGHKASNQTQFYHQSLDCKNLPNMAFAKMIQSHSSHHLGRYHQLLHQLVLEILHLHSI